MKLKLYALPVMLGFMALLWTSVGAEEFVLPAVVSEAVGVQQVGDDSFTFLLNDEGDVLPQIAQQLTETTLVETTGKIYFKGEAVGYLKKGVFLSDFEDDQRVISHLEKGENVWVVGVKKIPLVLIENKNIGALNLSRSDVGFLLSVDTRFQVGSYSIIYNETSELNKNWKVLARDLPLAVSEYKIENLPNGVYFFRVVSSQDSDADGLADALEMYVYGTNPNKADSDDDGLDDEMEVQIGTNPNHYDSDGDGIRDGDEFNLYHTDPLNERSSPLYLPDPYASFGVGNPSIRFAQMYYDSSFDIRGCGRDIWNYVDQFEYVYAPTDGDFDIVARVRSFTQTNFNSKASIMVRDKLDADAAFVHISLNANNGVRFQSRHLTGGTVDNYGNSTLGNGKNAPLHLRLKRVGNSFTGYFSDDAITWSEVGTTNANIRHNGVLGMGVCSMNVNSVSRAIFDKLNVYRSLHAPMIFDSCVLGYNDAQIHVETQGNVQKAYATAIGFSPSETVYRYGLDSRHSYGLATTFYATTGTTFPNFETCPVLGKTILRYFNATQTRGPIFGAPRSDYFGFESVGRLYVPKTQAYTFKIQADDRMELIIDDALLLANGYATELKTKTIELNEGIHDIKVRFWEVTGNASCLIHWSSNGFSERVLGVPFLFHEKREEFPEMPFESDIDPVMTLPAAVNDTGLLIRYYQINTRSVPDLSALGARFLYKVGVVDFIESPFASKRVFESGVKETLGVNLSGYLYVPEEGEYTFYLNSDDGVIVELDQRAIFVSPQNVITQNVKLNLKKGYYPINIDYINSGGNAVFTLEWSSEFIPRQFVSKAFLRFARDLLQQFDDKKDQDGDGLSDLDEVTLGTNLQKADSDDDGISDGNEFNIYKTNPLSNDTDGDGMSDYDEIFSAYSDPNKADFDGVVNDVIIVDGMNYFEGKNWVKEDPIAVCYDRAGTLIYKIQVDTAGIYRLRMDCVQMHPASSFNRFAMGLSIDGQRLGYNYCNSEGGSYFYLPYLTEGEHLFSITWFNQTKNNVLGIKKLTIQYLSGEWIENRLDFAAKLDMPPVSYVSPVCAEGRISTTSNDVQPIGFDKDTPIAIQTIRNNFYLNLHLNDSGISEFELYYKNIDDYRAYKCQWLETNISELNDSTLILRQGDELLLNLNTNDSITVNNLSYDVTSDTPLRMKFEQPGIVIAKGSDGSKITVKVIGGKFTSNPMVIANLMRNWGNPTLEKEIKVQSDPLLMIRKNQTYQASYPTYSLLSGYTGTYGVVARLYENGPITDVRQITVLTGDFDSRTLFSYIRTFPDGSTLVQGKFIMSDIPPNFKLKLKIFVAGIFFEDGSTERVFTAADFDENGVLLYRLIKMPTATTGLCHFPQFIDGDTIIFSAR